MLTRHSAALCVVLALSGSPVNAQQTPRQRAEAKLQEGDRAIQEKDPKKAQELFEEAAKLDPTWHRPHEALGNLHFANGRYAEAIAAFERALQIEPRYNTAYYNIAFAHRKAAAFDKAIEYYTKYLEKNPSDADAYYGLAESYRALGDRKGAILNYRLYAEREVRPSERQYVLKAREKAALLERELAALEKPFAPPVAPPAAAPPSAPPAAPPPATPQPEAPPAAVASQPAAPPASPPAAAPPVAPPAVGTAQVAAWIKEGDQAMESSAYTKAMKLYFDASRADPNNIEAIYKLGLVYEKTGNPRAARLKWTAVLGTNPNHKGAREGLARLEATERPSTKAAPEASATPQATPPAASPEEPQNAPARPVVGIPPDEQKAEKLMEEGDAYFMQKAFSKAIAAYTHATQLIPRSEAAVFKLATTYAYAGNLKVAIFKWRQVLSLNPDNQEARRNIQKAEAQLGIEPKEAKLAPVDPNQRAFEQAVAQAQTANQSGDAAGVLAATERALQIQKHAGVAILRGEALTGLGRYAEAKEAFSNAMVIDPGLAAPFYGLGVAHEKCNEIERARYYYMLYAESRAKDLEPGRLEKAKAFLSKTGGM